MNKIEKEQCPFCNSMVEVDSIEKLNRLDISLNYKCECGWEHTKQYKIIK